jgi:hypothetical protein
MGVDNVNSEVIIGQPKSARQICDDLLVNAALGVKGDDQDLMLGIVTAWENETLTWTQLWRELEGEIPSYNIQADLSLQYGAILANELERPISDGRDRRKLLQIMSEAFAELSDNNGGAKVKRLFENLKTGYFQSESDFKKRYASMVTQDGIDRKTMGLVFGDFIETGIVRFHELLVLKPDRSPEYPWAPEYINIVSLMVDESELKTAVLPKSPDEASSEELIGLLLEPLDAESKQSIFWQEWIETSGYRQDIKETQLAVFIDIIGRDTSLRYKIYAELLKFDYLNLKSAADFDRLSLLITALSFTHDAQITWGLTNLSENIAAARQTLWSRGISNRNEKIDGLLNGLVRVTGMGIVRMDDYRLTNVKRGKKFIFSQGLDKVVVSHRNDFFKEEPEVRKIQKKDTMPKITVRTFEETARVFKLTEAEIEYLRDLPGLSKLGIEDVNITTQISRLIRQLRSKVGRGANIDDWLIGTERDRRLRDLQTAIRGDTRIANEYKGSGDYKSEKNHDAEKARLVGELIQLAIVYDIPRAIKYYEDLNMPNTYAVSFNDSFLCHVLMPGIKSLLDLLEKAKNS